MADPVASTAEGRRLAQARAGTVDWRRWGTYLSERAWGTVREDYSADGDAWNYLPHDHARSRAYRWNEDGLAGWCDADQTIVMALGLWNGRDPILKERMFGLTNQQGNHGEDVKEYWFYLDNLPTHGYARMVYKYPQTAYPYGELVDVNAARGGTGMEYELFDALADDFRAGRYHDVFVEYAKVDAEDVLCRITAVNRGPDPAPIHLLPHLWYRNTWSWGDPGISRPALTRQGDLGVSTEHPALGERWWYAAAGDGTPGVLLFCENESNRERIWRQPNGTPYVKDGINDAVVGGAAGAVGDQSGSKVAAHFTRTLAPGESWVVTTRFCPTAQAQPFGGADALIAQRAAEADEFYGALQASAVAGPLSADAAVVQRQALAGLLWCKQYYRYPVKRWLDGDPTSPPPPAQRQQARNHSWQHLDAADVILMPDAWEYPWFAAWDLAFHCVSMALIDPDFAKVQIALITSAFYQHPYGNVPAYEWNFGDLNPPVLAWAAWQVYLLELGRTGVGDRHFLNDQFRRQSLVTTWWLNRKDAEERGIFGGGFLGMDNIGVFDRDQPLPTGGTLDQVDGTAWMATLTMHMLEISLELARDDPSMLDMLPRFMWDFVLIAQALEQGVQGVSLWDDEDGFYHDVVERPDGSVQPLAVFSLQSLVPLLAAIAVPEANMVQLQRMRDHADEFVRRHAYLRDRVASLAVPGDGSHALYGAVYGERLVRILQRMLDPAQFYSEHGIRSISAALRDNPYVLDVDGQRYVVRYLPAESDNRTFGGNSNWRGPVWFPLNFLLVQAMDTYGRFYGDSLTVELPTGSGRRVRLGEVADDLAGRLCSIFLRGPDGRRPVFGGNEFFQTDPHWRDYVPFHEYFHGDNGAGLGASHQTGWTASVALLVQYGGNLRFADLSLPSDGPGPDPGGGSAPGPGPGSGAPGGQPVPPAPH